MSGGSLDSVLYSSDGTELTVVSGSAIPTGTRGVIQAGSDGTNARFISVDSSGRVITVGAGVAGTPAGGVISIQGIASGTAITVSGTVAATQSGTFTVQPGNTANTTPWLVTALSATAANLLATVTQGPPNTLANAWSIKVTDGTNTMPTGDVAARAVYHRITDGTNTLGTSTNPLITQAGTNGYAGQVEGRAAAGVSNVGNPVYMGGTDGTTARGILTDTSGRIVVAPAGAVATTSGFALGTVTTAAITNVPVRATTYTEQTTNAQRSVSSSSASDASAGTGARTIKITYYDQTGAGPSTETITLNGTTAVNTVSSTICYIEKIEVLTVGATGSNVGIITLFAATAGGGGAVGTIAATDNRTFWCHHYTPTGKTSYITGVSANNNTAANGTVFSIRSKAIGGTAPEFVISDFIRAGGGGIQSTRTYGTPIQVVGPARILMYAAPEGTPVIINRASFDLYDQ